MLALPLRFRNDFPSSFPWLVLPPSFHACGPASIHTSVCVRKRCGHVFRQACVLLILVEKRHTQASPCPLQRFGRVSTDLGRAGLTLPIALV